MYRVASLPWALCLCIFLMTLTNKKLVDARLCTKSFGGKWTKTILATNGNPLGPLRAGLWGINGRRSETTRKLRPMTTFRTYYTLYCVIQSSLIKSIKIIESVTGCSLLEALILPKYNIKDVRIFFTKHWSKIGGSNQFSIQNWILEVEPSFDTWTNYIKIWTILILYFGIINARS